MRESLNEAWSANFVDGAAATPFAAMNPMNLGVRYWLGTAIEEDDRVNGWHHAAVSPAGWWR